MIKLLLLEIHLNIKWPQNNAYFEYSRDLNTFKVNITRKAYIGQVLMLIITIYNALI